MLDMGLWFFLPRQIRQPSWLHKWNSILDLGNHQPLGSTETALSLVLLLPHRMLFHPHVCLSDALQQDDLVPFSKFDLLLFIERTTMGGVDLEVGERGYSDCQFCGYP